MGIKKQRAHESSAPNDGCRILVARIWPRSISKQNADVALWLINIVLSTELRKWFGYTTYRWQEYRWWYLLELNRKDDELAIIHTMLKTMRSVTLVYSAKNTDNDQAVVSLGYLTKR